MKPPDVGTFESISAWARSHAECSMSVEVATPGVKGAGARSVDSTLFRYRTPWERSLVTCVPPPCSAFPPVSAAPSPHIPDPDIHHADANSCW